MKKKIISQTKFLSYMQNIFIVDGKYDFYYDAGKNYRED